MKVTTILLESYEAKILKKDASMMLVFFAEGLTSGVSVIPLAAKPPRKVKEFIILQRL